MTVLLATTTMAFGAQPLGIGIPWIVVVAVECTIAIAFDQKLCVDWIIVLAGP
jgi:hypothetical protein